jgi:predicted transposase YbfD/YdcC
MRRYPKDEIQKGERHMNEQDDSKQDYALIGAPFAELKDPRQAMNQLHKFIDILVIAICAAICGADDWEAVELFGEAKEQWFRSFLELPNGIPSHDTFWRVFRTLDPEQFQRCFMRWMAAIQTVTAGEVVALDGKQLRRSFDTQTGSAAITMVSAWASANQLVLGQRKVNEKSNEITAVPELLDALMLKGCIVTLDALNCQTKIAETIVEQEADYLLALKANHESLHADVLLLFETLAQDLQQQVRYAYPHDHAKSVDKDHGRIEVRQAWTINDADLIAHLRTAANWPHLTTLVKVQAERYVGNETSVQTRYYISSADASAQQFLAWTRSHWSIENSLHWVLDISFREDECRLRKDYGAINFATLRHIALNLLKQERTLNVGIKNKRLQAGWDHEYLLTLLQPIFVPA